MKLCQAHAQREQQCPELAMEGMDWCYHHALDKIDEYEQRRQADNVR